MTFFLSAAPKPSSILHGRMPSNGPSITAALFAADFTNFIKAYAKDLILPTAQEFANFQEEMRMQRRPCNLEDQNDSADKKQCAYFNGWRNNEAGYIELILPTKVCAD